jgi:hypothetical protein
LLEDLAIVIATFPVVVRSEIDRGESVKFVPHELE